jgi:ribosomal-protein-alanine N-acetyltransferase
MTTQPSLATERLILRPFVLGDGPAMRRLLDDIEIARNTLSIPHPYPDGEAERWIGTHAERFAANGDLHFAIVSKETNALAGAIGLLLHREHARAELGYWIGRAYWNRGYAAEAAAAVVEHGFAAAGLNRIFAAHFAGNPASGRVMQKIGMRHEGTHRQDLRKWGAFVDSEHYAILREEWEAARPQRGNGAPLRR